ncbi:sugar kinase [Neobacillus massiliamazoniensis]|uniref:2-dehydro-3-deoxygluconokinase n=1 Tax=Neobacillus massiliamazoniensis TaxID=1499688 RepID=A0A0U1NQE4_9BACI|nr:sugar kinase [Neobacillus massiliamazoniensis]CRK80260.1 2-dehydro-3-deoxygluconokinase [Neobacillus massiliamazoniensis]
MKKIVTLGEIMLRLSTAEGVRLNQSNQFTVHYGGAEANVAVSLSHFGYQAFFVSKVPANPLGSAVERHLKSHGVRTDYLLKGGERLGAYYLEAGVGERSTQVAYDRKNSSFSKLEAEEVVIEEILRGASLFHISGITLALSTSLRELVFLFLKKAKKMGIKTSFDFNYRAKLWTQQEASEVIKLLLPYIDICSCGELDAVHLLGLDLVGGSLPQEERLKCYYQKIMKMYPNIQYMCSTFRTVINASNNRLLGNLYVNGELYQSKVHCLEPIVDRVGGGDSFIAGILSGILDGLPTERIISFATAASALKHTVHGDCNPFSKEEVLQFTDTEPGKIKR